MSGTDHKRRNSIERYQPKRASEGETDGNEISVSLDKMSIRDEEGSADSRHNSSRGGGSNRRGVNSHLYGNTNQRVRGNRGRGRGRGRGGGQDNHTNRQEENTSSDLQNGQTGHKDNISWGQSASNGENVSFQSPGANYKQHDFNKKQINGGNQLDRNYQNKPQKKNTETFRPSHKPAEMRILCAHEGWTKYSREIQSRDVLIVHGLFCGPSDLTIYKKLLNEIKSSGIDQEDLWKLWHGDSHVIADDKQKWKDVCPTFHIVLSKIQEYFDMNIKATRLNWYRDSKEWKPFHHDAAAIKADKAKTQNLTVAVSFGSERDVAFEHATTKTVISMPQSNGTMYVFAKDVNVIWRHGILQVAPEKYHDEGRISIIAWGWSDQTPV